MGDKNHGAFIHIQRFCNYRNVTKIDIDEIGIKVKIKEEVERFKKFQQILVGKKDKIIVDDVDIRNYAKYILREGRDIEKKRTPRMSQGTDKTSR